MKPTYHYAPVSEALNILREKGFTYDFNLHENDIVKNPHKYEIKHVYRYEGDSDPADEAVVYAIKTASGENGVFVAGYSAKSGNAANVLAKLCIENNDQQCNF